MNSILRWFDITFNSPFTLVKKQIKALNETPSYPFPAGLTIKKFDNENGVAHLEPHGMRLYVTKGKIYALSQVALPIFCGPNSSRYEQYNTTTGNVSLICSAPKDIIDEAVKSSVGYGYFYIPLLEIIKFKNEIVGVPGEKLSPIDCFNYMQVTGIFSYKKSQTLKRKREDLDKRDFSIANGLSIPESNTVDREWIRQYNIDKKRYKKSGGLSHDTSQLVLPYLLPLHNITHNNE